MSAVANLRAQAGQFLAWWGSELAGMVPEAVRARRKPKPRSDIHIGPDGVTVDRVAGGIGERFHESRRIEDLGEDEWAELRQVVAGTRARLVLGVPDIYVAALSLPAAARGRVKQAVALQLPQLAPLEAAQLVWSAVAGQPQAGQIPVTVAMARAARVADLEALFDAHALPLSGIAAQGSERPIALCAARTGGGGEERRANRMAIAAAAALLLSIPFTTVAGAWLMAGAAEDRAEGIGKKIAPRLAAERAAQREAEARRALAVVHGHPSATSVIEAMALGMPDTDYLRGAGVGPNGTLQASVDSADPEALKAALAKAPLTPRPEAAEVAPIEEKPGRVRVELRSAGS
jgi:hypothetical protein